MPIDAGTEENPAAGVVAAAAWRVRAISVLPGYRLSVTFADETSGFVDLSAVRSEPSLGVFAALANPQCFDQAGVVLGVVTWPNGADLDPLWMYEEISTAKNKTWSVPF